MKRILLFCVLPLLFLTACSDKDDRSLVFDSQVYHVPDGADRAIDITSGNGSYTIKSEDETIVLAGFSNTEKKSAGNLLITGKSVGQTWVNVTDNATGETVRLKVWVTEPYFTIAVNTPEAVVRPENAENYTKATEQLYKQYPFSSEYVNFYLFKDGSLTVDERPARDDKGYTGTYSVEKNDAGNYGVNFIFRMGEKDVDKFYQVTGKGGLDQFVGYFFGEPAANEGRSEMTTDSSIALREDATDYIHGLYNDITSAILVISGEGNDQMLMKDSLFE